MSAHEEREQIAREVADSRTLTAHAAAVFAARIRALPVAADAGGGRGVLLTQSQREQYASALAENDAVEGHRLASALIGGVVWDSVLRYALGVDDERRAALPPAPDDADELLNLRYAVAAYDLWGAAGELVDAARRLVAKRDGQGVG